MTSRSWIWERTPRNPWTIQSTAKPAVKRSPAAKRIAANKVKGVRCGLCTSVEMAELTRKHNNANILALGGRTTDPELALEITKTWLDTEFEGGRHKRRTDMLDEMI